MASWDSYPQYQCYTAQQNSFACRPEPGLRQDAADINNDMESWIDISKLSRLPRQQQQFMHFRDRPCIQYDSPRHNGPDSMILSDERDFARGIFHAQMHCSVMPWQVEQPTSLDVAQSYPRLDSEALSSASDSSYCDSPAPKYLHYPVNNFDGFFALPSLGLSASSINPSETIHDLHKTCDDDADFINSDIIEIDSKLETHPLAPWPYGLEMIETNSEESSRQSSKHLSITLNPKFDICSDSDSEYEPTSKVKPRGVARGHAFTKITKFRHNKPSTTKRSRQNDKISKALETCKGSTKSSCRAEKEKIRSFACPLQPYGCTADFPSKNEWKRHFNSQHLCLGFWRCDLCDDHEADPNDFNRKDLFQQHLKRMHFPSPTKSGSPSRRNSEITKPQASQPTSIDASSILPRDLEEICSRCYVKVHNPPQEMACIFCTERFEGNDSCKNWLEHVGKHLSKLLKEGIQESGIAHINWEKDDNLRRWLLEVSAIVPDNYQGRTWQLAQSNVTAEIKARAFARKLEGMRRDQDADGDRD